MSLPLRADVKNSSTKAPGDKLASAASFSSEAVSVSSGKMRASHTSVGKLVVPPRPFRLPIPCTICEFGFQSVLGDWHDKLHIVSMGICTPLHFIIEVDRGQDPIEGAPVTEKYHIQALIASFPRETSKSKRPRRSC